MNKFVEPRPYADPEAAARKLLEIANALEPYMDGRILIERKEKVPPREGEVSASH